MVFMTAIYNELSVICEKIVEEAESSFTVSIRHSRHEASAECCALVRTSEATTLEPDSLDL